MKPPFFVLFIKMRGCPIGSSSCNGADGNAAWPLHYCRKRGLLLTGVTIVDSPNNKKTAPLLKRGSLLSNGCSFI